MAELEVIAADVTKLEVDAIANAANTRLMHGGGVAAAISRAGGPDVQRESDEKAPIGLGEAVETTAGDMPARYVIHAATMELGGPTSAEIIDRATRSTLEKAEELGCMSLALVAFGTGVGGFPLDEAARIMVGAAREHEGSARADRLRGARRGGRAGLQRGALSLPVLVSPDSFKGSFSAAEVAAAIAAGLRDAGREAIELPVADGGEGTMDVLGGELHSARGDAIRSAARSRPRSPCWTTAARRWSRRPRRSGFALVAEDERDAYAASTRGTGELIAAAVAAGAERGARGRGRLGHDGRRRGRGRGARGGRASSSTCSATFARRGRTRRGCSARRRAPTRPRSSGSSSASTALAERAPRDPRGEPMTGAAGALSGGAVGVSAARSSSRARPTCSTPSASTSACASPRSS